MFCSYTPDSWSAMGSMLAGLGQLGLAFFALIGVATWREAFKLNEQHVLVKRLSIIMAEIESQMYLTIDEPNDVTDEYVDSYFEGFRAAYTELSKIDLESWILAMEITNLLRKYKKIVTKYYLNQTKILRLTNLKHEIPDTLQSMQIELVQEAEELKGEIGLRIRVELWTFTGNTIIHRIIFKYIRRSNAYQG
jgi:hypothetical protein